MNYTQYSVDGGATWVDMCQDVRIIFREADEHDDSMLDLHLIATSEGIILDLVSQATGLVESTNCFPLDSLVEMLE